MGRKKKEEKKEEPTLTKSQALKHALASIEKKHGKGAVIRLGDMKTRNDLSVFSTGSATLDIATGIGGVPRGRVVEIYGPEASGKTTLCLHIVAEAQKQKQNIAFIDAEHALDPVYPKRKGVDIDNLLLSQPDSGEQGLEIVESWVQSGSIGLVVIDSVAALTPKAELAGDMGASHMGLQARLMSQALRKLVALVAKTNTCIIFINQLRMKIGNPYGNPETTTGGNALKFYASMRFDIRRFERMKDDKGGYYGTRHRVRIPKNKMARPFNVAEFEMYFGDGISKESSLIDAAVNVGVVTKKGMWFLHGKKNIGQGKDNARKTLEENIELTNTIMKETYEKAGLPVPIMEVKQ